MNTKTEELETRIARLEEALADARSTAPSNAIQPKTRVRVAQPSSLLRVIRSELIKLSSLRSTWVMLGTILTIVIAFGGIAAAVSAGVWSGPDGGGGDVGNGDPLSTVMTGSMFGVLLVGVLGCLAGAREYGSGMITVTIAAAPRRWQVVVGKATALAAFIIPTALVSAFGAFGVGMGILSANDAATVSLGDADVLGSVIGMAGYMTAIALLGLGLGVLLRSVASSIAVFVAGIMIVPGLAGALLPESWGDVLKFLPEQAAASFTAVGQSGDPTLSTGAGIAVLAAWVVAVIGGAIATITRRDV